MSTTKLASIAGALIAILFACVVAAGQAQNQSIVNTTKSNRKDSVAPQQPQEGAINTTRSNIKNTSREAGGRFDPIQLDLMKASGEKVASRQITDADNDGMISNREAAFDFGVLPTGDLKADLGSQPGSEVARAGKPKFKNILFKADGRSAVKGTLRHDPAMSSIQNMK